MAERQSTNNSAQQRPLHHTETSRPTPAQDLEVGQRLGRHSRLGDCLNEVTRRLHNQEHLAER
jgi:hypothetical protein